jgi:hypothetical protein
MAMNFTNVLELMITLTGGGHKIEKKRQWLLLIHGVSNEMLLLIYQATFTLSIACVENLLSALLDIMKRHWKKILKSEVSHRVLWGNRFFSLVPGT